MNKILVIICITLIIFSGYTGRMAYQNYQQLQHIKLWQQDTDESIDLIVQILKSQQKRIK